MTIFPTPSPESVTSLLKQLHTFKRPTGGKKPVAALPPSVDLSRDSGSPFTPREDGTPAESDEERPRKKSRVNRNEEKDGGDVDTNGDGPISPRKGHGKKPGGKTAGKGTKPRTVVRGARGLIPMETDAKGNQHVAGRLPDSAVGEDDDDEEEEEEEEVPLAQRPQLDEGERRRREVIKERAREREDELLRQLTKGSNVEDGTEGHGRTGPHVDMEVWEGVDLVCSAFDLAVKQD